MKIDIKAANYDAREESFGGSKLMIKPFPLSRSDAGLKDGVLILTGENNFKIFDESLESWDIIGADGKPLPCTTEVKRKVFDFGLGEVNGEKISDFVIAKALNRTHKEEVEIKN